MAQPPPRSERKADAPLRPPAISPSSSPDRRFFQSASKPSRFVVAAFAGVTASGFIPAEERTLAETFGDAWTVDGRRIRRRL
jgi:hypothetical protein